MSTTITPVASATGTPPTPDPATSGVSATPDPVPATPVVYDLKLPDVASLPADAIERMTAIARESGLSNDAAQKALDFANQEASARITAERDALLQAHQPGGAEWQKVTEGWKAETMADTALGKTPDERKAAIDKGISVINKFVEAHPKNGAAFKAFLNDTGLGNHPSTVRFFAWLGTAAGEPQTFVSGSQTEEKDQRKVWFPNTKFPGQDAA